MSAPRPRLNISNDEVVTLGCAARFDEWKVVVEDLDEGAKGFMLERVTKRDKSISVRETYYYI
jgi:GH15 family glucan-1,4-alpha-glucosidase